MCIKMCIKQRVQSHVSILKSACKRHGAEFRCRIQLYFSKCIKKNLICCVNIPHGGILQMNWKAQFTYLSLSSNVDDGSNTSP